jgi:hypothetical protein
LQCFSFRSAEEAALLRREIYEPEMATMMQMHHRDFSTRLHLQEFHQGNVMLGCMSVIPMKSDTPHEKYKDVFLHE